ncbi:MAG: hypothetical protein QOH05_4621 [Acetobacteraceae bacterium]|jgi:hypothetical protein|nr:hypothetical protein [Acetobacteraceae bacterium]
MRQSSPTARSATHSRPGTSTAIDHQDRMIRGLVHGVILSLAVWIAAGWLTFMLH